VLEAYRSSMHTSELGFDRQQYQPALPAVLAGGGRACVGTLGGRQGPRTEPVCAEQQPCRFRCHTRLGAEVMRMQLRFPATAGPTCSAPPALHRCRSATALPAWRPAGPHEVVEGATRECVESHDIICVLFPRLSDGGESPLRMVHLTPATSAAGADEAASREQRPLKLGVVLSGGQAPGGGRVGLSCHMPICRHPPCLPLLPACLRAWWFWPASSASLPKPLPLQMPPGPHPSHSGGHHVIICLHDYLQRWHPGSRLLGFLGGPRGVMRNAHKLLPGEELVSTTPLLLAHTMLLPATGP
jgi:hypothetical protein